MNAILAPLLSQLIGAFEILVTDKLPNSVRLLKGLIDCDTGGAVITQPYQVKAFEGYDDVSIQGIAEAYMVANPTYWFSPVQYRYSDQIPGISTRSLIFVLYNTNAADGAANWDPGYVSSSGSVPAGPAAGDLSGTYPNPVVGPTTTGQTASGAIPAAATVIGTHATAAVGDVLWEVKLQKGSTQYNSSLRANLGDGVTPNWVEHDIAINPAAAGTFDCPLTVVITGANITLVCTPATAGWSARVRARTFTP